MSVPRVIAPKCAADTKMEPVPQKGSHTTPPGRACVMLHIIKAISTSIDVGPRYRRFVRSYFAIAPRPFPKPTTRPKYLRRGISVGKPRTLVASAVSMCQKRCSGSFMRAFPLNVTAGASASMRRRTGPNGSDALPRSRNPKSSFTTLNVVPSAKNASRRDRGTELSSSPSIEALSASSESPSPQSSRMAFVRMLRSAILAASASLGSQTYHKGECSMSPKGLRHRTVSPHPWRSARARNSCRRNSRWRCMKYARYHPMAIAASEELRGRVGGSFGGRE